MPRTIEEQREHVEATRRRIDAKIGEDPFTPADYGAVQSATAYLQVQALTLIAMELGILNGQPQPFS